MQLRTPASGVRLLFQSVAVQRGIPGGIWSGSDVPVNGGVADGCRTLAPPIASHIPVAQVHRAPSRLGSIVSRPHVPPAQPNLSGCGLWQLPATSSAPATITGHPIILLPFGVPAGLCFLPPPTACPAHVRQYVMCTIRSALGGNQSASWANAVAIMQ